MASAVIESAMAKTSAPPGGDDQQGGLDDARAIAIKQDAQRYLEERGGEEIGARDQAEIARGEIERRSRFPTLRRHSRCDDEEAKK